MKTVERLALPSTTYGPHYQVLLRIRAFFQSDVLRNGLTQVSYVSNTHFLFRNIVRSRGDMTRLRAVHLYRIRAFHASLAAASYRFFEQRGCDYHAINNFGTRVDMLAKYNSRMRMVAEDGTFCSLIFPANSGPYVTRTTMTVIRMNWVAAKLSVRVTVANSSV